MWGKRKKPWLFNGNTVKQGKMAFWKEKATAVGALMGVPWLLPSLVVLSHKSQPFGLEKCRGLVKLLLFLSQMFQEVWGVLFCFCFPRLSLEECVSELSKHQNPLEGLLKHKLLGPRVSESVWGGAHEFAFLMSSQVILILPFPGPHLGNSSPGVSYLGGLLLVRTCVRSIRNV